MLIEALTRGSIENPKIPLSSENILPYLRGGLPSATGIAVSRDTALAIPAMFNGVRLISESVAKLPLVVYRRLPSGGKERAVGHPAYRLLLKQPNEVMTAFEMIRTLTANALLHGNGYAWVQRDNMRPTGLYWLDPETTFPVHVTTIAGDKIVEKNVWYMTTINSKQYKIPFLEIVHIKGFGHDGISGHSVIRMMKDPLGLAIAAHRYSATYFKNDATPRMVIQLVGSLKDEAAIERLRATWGSIHAGIDNAHKPAILENNATVKPLSVSAKDSQLIENMEFSLVDVANVLGLPAELLNANRNTSYSSLEQQNRNFLNYSLGGWLCGWKQETELKLLGEVEKQEDTHVIEQVRDELERADRKTEAEVDTIYAQGGLRLVDELRARANLAPYPDGIGSEPLFPLNHATLATLVNPPEPAPAPVPILSEPDDEDEPPVVDEDDDDNRLLPFVEHQVRRLIVRVAADAERQAQRPKGFLEWLDTLDNRHGSLIREALSFAGAGAVAERMVTDMHTALLEVSGQVTADQLHSAVKQIMQVYELDNARPLAEEVCNGKAH